MKQLHREWFCFWNNLWKALKWIITTHTSSFSSYLSHSNTSSVCHYIYYMSLGNIFAHTFVITIFFVTSNTTKPSRNSFPSTKKKFFSKLFFFNLNSYTSLEHMWKCRKGIRRIKTVVGFYNKLLTFQKLKFFFIIKISQPTSSTFRKIVVKLFTRSIVWEL